ncbi:hypothetical protein [Clostridium sp. CCUG 7971]|uniref:hypothetical protein n=1 Tax=Clostridium sp. CCUG 7971 TaxID=2811414 RepID=UPI001ABB4AAF|nr:hypothetical protein [Clostridium sp. CCUG 7971]MBO3445746.1 hypothetical protein [Clostridium sp. CCUG 7971]
MSKQLRIINWIIGGIITILYLYGPMWSMQYNFSSLSEISRIVASVFLIYCLISGIYWIKNKKTKMAFHYFLIVAVYIAIAFTIFIIAVHRG